MTASGFSSALLKFPAVKFPHFLPFKVGLFELPTHLVDKQKFSARSFTYKTYLDKGGLGTTRQIETT